MIPPEENLTFWSASQSASQRGAPDRCAHARGVNAACIPVALIPTRPARVSLYPID